MMAFYNHKFTSVKRFFKNFRFSVIKLLIEERFI